MRLDRWPPAPDRSSFYTGMALIAVLGLGLTLLAILCGDTAKVPGAHWS